MSNYILKSTLLAVGFVSSILLTGCTNWQKKYQGLMVEHQNLQGRYENSVRALDASRSEKSQLSSQLQQYETTISQLQKEIDEQKSAAKASGFGEKYDVDFDPNKGTLTVTLPNEILFSPGKASLKTATNSDLNHIVSVIKSKYNGREVDVVGHTDSDPIKKSKWKDNWQLSSERALTVLRYLNDHGIEAKLVRAVACGQSRPKAVNTTAAGKAKNRRVEIVVHMK